MKVLTSEEIKNEFIELHGDAVKKYGSATDIPHDVRFYMNELMRARYCVMTNPSWTPEQIVGHYSIDWRVAQELLGVDKDLLAKKAKRVDKYDSIRKWCEENIHAEVTANEIAEIGEISYQTALKYISDNLHVFRKVTRGKYEVRDPKADREAEKQS